ncbi:ShlB/FhaC/HecB family hemolysin secretion/activation protein [Nodosilinea sp. LEGE 07088]|uniref:ShlB/FhaC/HecB family hemolysin secretion/activation protein n=1 Tax=Nodosilinea sp. LEGE 07088 TaxID=2777968 RepID=UPI00187EF638|nr:ShlB/FhaC/HecB family hemolysin secretion/activation protein [Nodosilinea sp. LEGE 07088]MBE9137038.1 ShlB/FhaC/HecB family hemolysin secretion/activation protein [Nodosilinea sp. LEGE 07088]
MARLEASILSPESIQANTPEANTFPLRLVAEDIPSVQGNLERFQVSEIEVLGSTVFTSEELDAVVAPFENRLLTEEELSDITGAVTELYVEGGYINSQAVIPEQAVDPDNGVIRIQVIEGGIEDIQVEGSSRLAEYLKSRLAPVATRPLNLIVLEDKLRVLQLDPLFDKVQANLKEGSSVGNSILVVTVEEANPISFRLALDTLSPPSVGQFRTGATFQYLNFAGIGDQFQASAYRSTTGGSHIYDLSYQVPLNPQDGTLLLRFAPSSFRITDPTEPLFQLGLQGSTNIYEVAFRQPLIRTTREELAFSLGFRHRNGSTLIGGLITPPTVTSVISFGQDYLSRDPNGAWSLRSEFRVGTGLFDATSNPAPLPDGQFFSWNGQAQRVQVLNSNNFLVIQGNIQLTPDSLLGSEQFFIGGAQSVRGYYQNGRFGDNGFRFSMENRISLQRDEGGNTIFQASPFIDLGYVWASNPNFQVADQNFLLGTGLGLTLVPTPNLDARIDFGVPLITLDEFPSDRPSGLRIYFDVNYKF